MKGFVISTVDNQELKYVFFLDSAPMTIKEKRFHDINNFCGKIYAYLQE